MIKKYIYSYVSANKLKIKRPVIKFHIGYEYILKLIKTLIKFVINYMTFNLNITTKFNQ